MPLKHADHRCTRHLIEHVLDVKLDDHVPRMCLQMHADKMNQDVQAPVRARTELLWFVKLPQRGHTATPEEHGAAWCGVCAPR